MTSNFKNFLRKRWSSGSSEKFQYELDKSKSNKTVLKIEDKQTVTYTVNSGASGTNPPGLAKANHPLSSSVPLSYFEVFIVSGGKDNLSSSTIAIGLATHEYSTDLFPGWMRGSYGYHGDDGRKYSGLPGGLGEGYGPTFSTGDVIGVGLDNASNNIFFTKNGRYLGLAFKRTGMADLYPCVGLNSVGETAFVNFVPPFVFDHVAAQTGGVSQNPSIMEEVHKGRGYDDLQWDPNRCGKSLEIVNKLRAQVLSDSAHSAIGVVQCSLPFSPYHAETFSYFEVLIERLEKGHVSVGLSNHEYPLNLHIGWLKRSYGYHSDDGRKFKWKEHESGTNDGELYGPSFGQGDVVGCGLNLQTRELYFTKNGNILGVAFTNVYGILYPSVALTGPGDVMLANFYPPFKYSLFTNALIPAITAREGSIGSSTGSNNSLSSIPPPPPPPLFGHGQLSVSAPNIRSPNSSGQSPTISESPPRAHSFLVNHSSINTHQPYSSRNSPQQQIIHTSSLCSSTNAASITTILGTSPSQRNNNSLPNVKSQPCFSTVVTNHKNSLSTTGNSNESLSSNNSLGQSNPQLTYRASASCSTPSPPVSPRTVLSNSNSSISDDAHVMGAPTPAPTPALGVPSLSSSGGSASGTGNGWKKCGKSVKLKDEITATLSKKKTGLVQSAFRCSTAQRLWYFEVYIEGMDKRTATLCIGLTCEDYTLSKHIGREPKSFGYFSDEGRKWKNGETSSATEAYGPSFISGDVVGCGFNTVTREIFFTKNGQYLGVAFWDVPEVPLFPSVSLRGVVGLTCVATFHGPFKFDLHTLPDISPSMWSESLGDSTLSDEQVIYPPSVNSSRLQQQQQQQNWNKEGTGRELRGLYVWPANDVAIWLESIGYGQYRKEFYHNNISGRHLHTLSHQLLKNELKIDSYGHRADILDRVNKLFVTWKEKVGNDDSAHSSIMDYADIISTTGSERSDFSENYPDHANSTSINDSHPTNEDLLQPYRHHHNTQVPHRFPDLENSEDESIRPRTKHKLVAVSSTQHQSNPNMHVNSNNPSINASLMALLANSNDKDARWRRRTVPCPDAEVREAVLQDSLRTSAAGTPGVSSTTPHSSTQLTQRSITGRPRTNTGNLPLPNFDINEVVAQLSIHAQVTPPPSNLSYTNHKPKPFQNHSQLATSTYSSSPPVIHTPQPLLHPPLNFHMSNSLTTLPSFTHAALIPSPATSTSLQHSSSATSISTTPPKRTISPLARSHPSMPLHQSALPLTPTANIPATTSPSSNHTYKNNSTVPDTTNRDNSELVPTRKSSEITVEFQDWEIDFKELELGPVIGKGFFGEVKRGSWRETDVAIKIIYRDSFKSKTSFDMFMNEVCILSKLRHPCVVQFLGACTTGDTHCIVTEWMPGGSLRNFLNSHFQAITPLVRTKIGLDIAKGMNYLHGWTPPILHRDLSSRNILLDVDSIWNNSLTPSLSSSSLTISSPAQPVRASSVRCKVADFGLSRLKLEHGVMTASVGCIPYMAPEVYKGEANSEKSDVYSYGMILWEVLSGEEPQQDMKPLKMAHLAAHGGYRPPLGVATPSLWRALITACWTEDPDARPNFRSVIGQLKDMEEKEKIALAALRLSSSSSGSSSSSSCAPTSSSSSPSSTSTSSSSSLPPPKKVINVGEYTD